jgi:nucleotide-binding universal stress UspA family protein
MKKILVPCDFSQPAIEAFKFAVSLAETWKGEITVLHVIDLPLLYDPNFGGQSFPLNAGMVKVMADESKKRFDRMRARYGKNVSKVKLITIQGAVTTTIRQHMDNKKPDVVVMGTHGATGAKELFVGSNAEKMVRFSKVPVFAIRKAVHLSSVKNIVFPTSLQLNQGDFIKKLKELQSLFNAKLHVLYVNTPAKYVSDEELKDYAKYYKLTNYTLNLKNNLYEQDGILAFAKEKKANMIAMSTHARKGLAHLVYGSIAEDVVNHLDYPIWTYVLKKTR